MMPSTSLPVVVPMNPVLVHEPFHRPGWIYEEKVDGWRMLAYKDSQRVASSSATAPTWPHACPDIAAWPVAVAPVYSTDWIEV